MLKQMQIILLILIGLVNIYTFLLYFRDKQKARKRQYRIPEKKLLTATFLLGGIGAAFGMYGLRHKTKHLKFKLSVPIALFITFGALYFVWTY